MHTTALCSPTRSCILTGRNHHSNHMACITEGATGYPGYDGVIPFENGFLSETLVELGYNTFAVGKWHLTPAHEVSPAGPYVRWPLGRGFERYYGFLGGDTHQYYPELDLRQPHRRAAEVARGGLPPHRGPRRQGDLVRRRQQADRSGQAVLHVLLPGRAARPAPRAGGMVRPVQGAVRRRLGRLPGEGLQAAVEGRHHPEGHRAVAARRRRPGLEEAARQGAEAVRPDDGGVRRLPGAHRPSHRATDRLPRRARRARQHADHGDLRQRRQLRGRPDRIGQREQVLQQRARLVGAEPRRARRSRRTEVLQPLRLGMDLGGQHAVPSLEAGDVPRRRHRPVHRPLAEGDQGQGSHPHTSTPTPSTWCRPCSMRSE